MVKRIVWVALYTGMSQVLSLFTLSYVVRNFGVVTSGYIGIVDSYILVISTMISFGIQLAVNRNVAVKENWKSNYTLAQGARLTLSLIVLIIGLLVLLLDWHPTKLIFLAAPFMALNGDYALYGNGKPIHAARLSFFRVAIPNAGILLTAKYIPEYIVYLYIALAVIGIANSGFFASRINGVPYLFSPTRKFYKIYLKYYKVGIFQLSFAILITGILSISKWFYTIETIGLVYSILKYFEVFKGVLRIVVQAFFKEIQFPHVSLRIDKFGILIGGAIVIPAFLYTSTTLTFLYDYTFEGKELLLVLFGCVMLVASLKPSADIRALFLHWDNLNMIAYLSALFAAVTVIILFSFSPYQLYGIPTGLLLGELILLVILGSKIGGWTFFKERFSFAFKVAGILLVVSSVRALFEPSLITMLGSCVLYGILCTLVFRKIIFGAVLNRS